ncbi:unnamed protein product [Dimorphilus gyrociliatus]|uniref:Uncharacterized protein n=1 Tax=Dimorphilus gyrociliatus TaxID=2664684 RepID=A0A7I8WEW1_9ANNE|nr:unnamed protein product [Dimorphilus gyrociliatus]
MKHDQYVLLKSPENSTKYGNSSHEMQVGSSSVRMPQDRIRGQRTAEAEPMQFDTTLLTPYPDGEISLHSVCQIL